MRPISAHQGAPPRRPIGLRRLGLAVAAVALLSGSTVSGQAEQGLRVLPLVRAEQVLVSFELTEGFTSDVRAAIHSGLKTTFTYVVDLRLDVPFGFDRAVGSAVVTSIVEYDNLTRKHTLERQIDGRLDDTVVTDDESAVRRWMTTLVQLPLFQTALLQPNREYYVRVSASARPSQGTFLWPFGSGTSAQTKFTFIR